MKKNFLIMLFILTVQAQCLMAQPYMPMSQFDDTLIYLKYNFETRKSQYIGYTLEKVINDYELEIKIVSYIGPHFYSKDKLNAISISHFTLQESRRRTENKIPKINFIIEFEPPYADYYVTARAAPSGARERALYVKDKIVKDIKVFVFDPNVPPPPPPPPLERNDDLIIIFKYTVTVNIDGNGTVVGAGQHDPGSNVTLTATPAVGYKFTGWQGDITSTVNPFTISSISSNISVTAKFAPNPPPDPGGGGKKLN